MFKLSEDTKILAITNLVIASMVCKVKIAPEEPTEKIIRETFDYCKQIIDDQSED